MTRREAKGLLLAVKDRINEIKKFGLNAAAYLTVNTFVFTMNMTQGPDGPIFMIPLVLWGIPLALHWKKVFGRRGEKVKLWEEAMLHEFMYGEEMPEPPDEILLTAEKKHRILRLSQAKDEEINTLQKRIENLEAIITSKDWDALEEKELAMAKVEVLSKEVE